MTEERAPRDEEEDTMQGHAEREPTVATQVELSLVRPERAKDERYQPQGALASGGMGDIVLARDTRIGRDVAMKRMRGSAGLEQGAEQRFLLEACVQGQLEHPAIVPVYDLGLGPEGDAFFTMRRVYGLSLKEILRGLRAGDEALAARFSRRKLLTAFSAVCLAVDYAHERGVLHRDLKPSNLMLGDYGEVYVLDWGLAKLVRGGSSDSPVHADPPPPTRVGAMLGTLGYMPPEQAKGEIEALDRQSDIYALGAILFEILTFIPLHPRVSRSAMLRSTLDGADPRASVRAPDRAVPPELEAICARATRSERRERYPSARELAAAVDRHLDGDRDSALRRAMVDKELALAEERCARIFDGRSPDEPGERRIAMQALGRALALDPTEARATRALARLLLEPPRELPEEATEAIYAARVAQFRTAGRTGALAYAAWFLYLPLYFWLGVQDWFAAAVVWGLVPVSILINYFGSRVERLYYVRGTLSLVSSSIVILLLSRMFGPLVFVPALLTANSIAYAVTPESARTSFVVAVSSFVLLLPSALEWAGITRTVYDFTGGRMCIAPDMVRLVELPVRLWLVGTALGGVVIATIYVGRIRGALVAAETKLHVYVWHLRQLVP